MKAKRNIIYAAFAAFVPIPLVLAFVAFAISASTANGAPGDLIAPGSHGNIYQLPINPFGTPSLVWDNSNLPFHLWGGLAFDSSGNIYVSESYGGDTNGAIWKLSADRSNLTLFATGLNPVGLAVDAVGNVYAANPSTSPSCGDCGSIYKFTPEGVRSTFASGLTLAGYRTPNIFFDAQGNLWVPSGGCGELYNAIYQITPQGNVGTLCLYTEGFGNLILAIALDNSGNIWVAVHTYPGHDALMEFVEGGGIPVAVVGYTFGITGLIPDTAGNVYLGQGHVVRSPPECVEDPPSPCSVNMADPSESLGQLAIQPPTYAAGVQPPINSDGTSVFNAHRGVVSVRFSLTYGGAATCALPPATIAVTRTAGGVTGQVNESVYTASADTGSNFRINGCQYMYNLDSRALGVGVYRVDIKIYDGAVGNATFELR